MVWVMPEEYIAILQNGATILLFIADNEEIITLALPLVFDALSAESTSQ